MVVSARRGVSRRHGPYDDLVCTDDGQTGQTPVVFGDLLPSAELEIQLEPVDSVVVTTLIDNVTDTFMPDQGPARRGAASRGPARAAAVMAGGKAPDVLIAEHGFSVLITVTKGGREHKFLFDAGTSPDGMTENMRRLQIEPGSIEAIVCSHGHFDHTTGIDGFIRSVGRANMPVLIHPHFWRRRRIVLPGRDPLELPATSRRALTEAGFDIIEEQQPSFLFDGSVLVTGEVPRTTGYEPGFPPQQAWLAGSWQPDPLVLDDQAVIVNVAGKGLVVLTGCGHAGVVNIARYAQLLTGGQRLYALLGGFHLNGPLFEPLIPRVLDDLAALDPDWLVPAHCTGWRAQHAMSARFGDVFVPNSVGTSFHF
jgi:7,8-dihydropterin-6-yl-methyl-4-(beta-D-ribofuranosyl)aminobenzene 5'-phosphate synthase